MNTEFLLKITAVHDDYMQIDEKYQCNGKQTVGRINFVNTPPLLVFVIGKELSDTITDTQSIPKKLLIYAKQYSFAGCTIFCNNLKHFVAIVFHSENNSYYFYDALHHRFELFSHAMVPGGIVSLLIYFLEQDGNTNDFKRGFESTEIKTDELSRKFITTETTSDYIKNTPKIFEIDAGDLNESNDDSDPNAPCVPKNIVKNISKKKSEDIIQGTPTKKNRVYELRENPKRKRLSDMYCIDTPEILFDLKKRKGKRINDIIAELKRKSDVTVSELPKLTSESNAKEKKKKIEQNFHKEWQAVSIMRWGGQVIIDCNRSVQHMQNTCTMDNVLWICMCWYRSKPCTVAFLEKSSNNAARSFIDVLHFLLAGSYEDAKYHFGHLNSNKTPAIDSANFRGCDTDLSSAPLMSILERKGRFRCNSHYCPGDAPRTLCNAILSVTSTEDKNFNLLETAIKM